MTRILLPLLLAALTLPLPARAKHVDATPVTLTVSPAVAASIGLRTATLRSRHWRATWTAYGQVVSPATLGAAASRLIDARQTRFAAQATAAASHAEYRRLQGLYAQHANVSRRQLEAARARARRDRAGCLRARAVLVAARDRVRSTWGPVIAGWLRNGSSRLRRLQSGRARLLRLSLPGHSRVVDPVAPVSVVTVDGVRITAHWISAAPADVAGLPGATFYLWTTHDVDRLGYGSRVLGRLPHGPVRHGVRLPRSAVVWSGAAAWAFVRSGPHGYRRVPVSTRHPTPDGWFETHGPAAGDVVVTRGAQVLLSIQQRATAPSAAASGDDDDDD